MRFFATVHRCGFRSPEFGTRTSRCLPFKLYGEQSISLIFPRSAPNPVRRLWVNAHADCAREERRSRHDFACATASLALTSKQLNCCHGRKHSQPCTVEAESGQQCKPWLEPPRLWCSSVARTWFWRRAYHQLVPPDCRLTAT
jgi:hypothetical protein